MRNIVAYPLKDEEILAYLDAELIAFKDSQLVGGMQGMILEALKQRVLENPYEPNQITGNITTETSTTTARD